MINIEKVEVAQPEEINLEFGQNVWGNLNIEKNKTENIQNGIKNDSRVNDKYLENFHNSSATNNTDGDMTASDDNNGGDNLTFFVHKLLSKRNSEDDNKMDNLENEHQNITTPDAMVSINSTEVPATYLKLQDIEIENYELNENYTDYIKYNISDINDDNDTLSEQDTMTPKTIDLEKNHDNITVTEKDYSESNDKDQDSNDTDSIDTNDITQDTTEKTSDKCENNFTTIVNSKSFQNCSQASSFLQTHCPTSVDVKSKTNEDKAVTNQDINGHYNGTDMKFFQFHGETLENLSHNLTSYTKDEDCCDVMDAVKILRVMLAFIKDDTDIINEISVKKSKFGWDYKLNNKTVSMKETEMIQIKSRKRSVKD